MSILSNYRKAFADALAAALGRPAAEVLAEIKPADPKFGDFSFATHPMAKTLKKAPPLIAKSSRRRCRRRGSRCPTRRGT